MRVDCHSHTMWSGDCTTTPDELAQAVATAGVDVLCITDHATVAGARRLAEDGVLACRVVIGEEQRTPEGEVIGLFLSERLPPGPRSAADAARAIRGQGGLVYIPHPLDASRPCVGERVLRSLCGEGLVDAIETLNARTPVPLLNERAAELAAELGIAAGAGSDAHVPEALGAAYVETGDFADGDAQGFLAALRSGVVVGGHFDPPRRWRNRVVPSTRAAGTAR